MASRSFFDLCGGAAHSAEGRIFFCKFLKMYTDVQILGNGGTGIEERGDWMGKKLTGAERDRFCREFLISMDPNRAAKSIGRADGYALLRKSEVSERLKWMRRMELPTRQDILRRLGQMAFGRVSDAAKLASRELVEAGELDLSDVAELKITDKGTEMKLIDRVQALETLWGLLEEGGEDGMERFLQALKTEDEKEGPGRGGGAVL